MVAQVKAEEFVAKSREVDVPDRPAAMAYWPKSVLDMDPESDLTERMHPTVRAPSNYLRTRLDLERINR
jgi:hypothetical protein